MMTKAQKKARQVLRKHNLHLAPININKIMKAEKLVLDEWEFRGRVKEVYVGDRVGIKLNTDLKKKRELIAHALGHHFLHIGNHLYFDSVNQFAIFKQEQEAQCFASELLMPTDLLKKMEHRSLKDISNHFNLSANFARFGLEVLKEDMWR